MLKLRIKEAFDTRKIKSPIKTLQKFNYSYTVAYRIYNQKIKNLSPKHIEDLCIILNCTPSELFVWTPDTPEQDKPTFPLYSLKRKITPDITEIISKIPESKLHEFSQKIKELSDQI